LIINTTATIIENILLPTTSVGAVVNAQDTLIQQAKY